MKPVWGALSEEYKATEFAADEGMATVVKVTTKVVAKYKDFFTAQAAAAEMNGPPEKRGQS
jgi:hypothetical protein